MSPTAMNTWRAICQPVAAFSEKTRQVKSCRMPYFNGFGRFRLSQGGISIALK